MLSETVNKKDKEKFISKTQETIEKAKRALKHVKNGKWLTTITDSKYDIRVSKVRTDFYSEAQTIGGESNSMFIFDVSVRTDQGPSSIIIGDLSLEETRRPQKYLVRSQVGTCKAYSKKELVHLIKEQARYLQ